MNHRVVWIVAVLVVVAAVVAATFAFGLVRYEPPRHEESTGARAGGANQGARELA
jgi:hypothetical protein